MDKDTKNILYMLVNTQETMKGLLVYAKYREDRIKEALTKATTLEEMKFLQGAIDEIRRFQKIKEEVNWENN